MKIVNRIKASDDFALAIKKGKVQRNQSYTIHYCENELGYTRVGISVSSKLGNAVVRNRAKRQVRMICDEALTYSQSIDIVIVVRKNYLDRSFEDNKESFKQILFK